MLYIRGVYWTAPRPLSGRVGSFDIILGTTLTYYSARCYHAHLVPCSAWCLCVGADALAIRCYGKILPLDSGLIHGIQVLDDPRCAALKVPFCVFQKTIGDTVPDVLKSKIGLRSVVCF